MGGSGFNLGNNRWWWRGVRFILGGGGFILVAVGSGRFILGDGRWGGLILGCGEWWLVYFGWWWVVVRFIIARSY